MGTIALGGGGKDNVEDYIMRPGWESHMIKETGGRKMKRGVAAMLGTAMLCVLLTGNAVYGFKKSDLAGLDASKQCPRCDLSGADLSGQILSGADLNAANLSGANLIGTDLSKSDMDGADLKGANLSAANLTGTDLTGADMSGANLYGANLTRTELDGATLSGATWTDGRKCKPGSVDKCIR
jgi:uncharacterized protein YjbI with pentapeptide repeats